MCYMKNYKIDHIVYCHTLVTLVCILPFNGTTIKGETLYVYVVVLYAVQQS